jgi:D-amino peptidase
MTGAWTRITINGRDVSEFFLNTYTAAMFKVPVVFVSGDQGLCDDVAALNPAIATVAVKKGVGSSTVSIHPELAVTRIREEMTKALKGNLSKYLVTLPDRFSVDIQYKDHTKARQYSFYPGAKLTNSLTIHFEHADYYEVLRFMFFVS